LAEAHMVKKTVYSCTRDLCFAGTL